jgi:aspartate/methionine/tyrosine aminotransferase
MRKLVQSLPQSLIRAVANRWMGTPGLIPLWFGEGDQPTDARIVAAAQESLGRGETFYGQNLGLPALREAIAAYQQRAHTTTATCDHVAVTSSGLNALLLVLSALIDPGDELVALTPTWPNILAIPTILNATVRTVALRFDGVSFGLDMDELLATLSPRTKVVLINSPQNPTGWRMREADMAALAGELARRGIWLVADEVYARIVAPGAQPRSFLDLFANDARIVIVNSFSKSWAMTGWRLGWITAPRAVVAALETLIEYNTSCAPTFVQRAGLVAMGPIGEAVFEAQQARLAAARTALLEALAPDERLIIPRTDATFYLFPRVRGLTDGVALAHRAAAAGVGMAPGEAFGGEGTGHIRLCFARDPALLPEAARRLRTVLADPV